MANRFLDYFDDDDTTSMQRRWVVGGNGNLSIQATGGRGGRACARQGAGAYAVRALDAHATYHIGFAYIPETLSGGGRIGYIGGASGSPHLSLHHSGAGKLYVTDSAGTTIWTSSSVVVANSENYIWWSSTISASSGSTAVYLNGSATPDATAFSGATKGADPAAVETMIFFPTGHWFRWHDIVFNDGAGPSPYNTRGSDMKVFRMRPNGAGASTGLSRFGAASNHAAVSEAGAPDGDTSYVFGTAGRDMYTLAPPSFTMSAVYSTAVRLTARKTDATGRTVVGSVRVGSTNYDGTPVSPGTSYGDYDFPFNLNPATGVAWSPAELIASQIGEDIA